MFRSANQTKEAPASRHFLEMTSQRSFRQLLFFSHRAAADTSAVTSRWGPWARQRILRHRYRGGGTKVDSRQSHSHVSRTTYHWRRESQSSCSFLPQRCIRLHRYVWSQRWTSGESFSPPHTGAVLELGNWFQCHLYTSGHQRHLHWPQTPPRHAASQWPVEGTAQEDWKWICSQFSSSISFKEHEIRSSPHELANHSTCKFCPAYFWVNGTQTSCVGNQTHTWANEGRMLEETIILSSNVCALINNSWNDDILHLGYLIIYRGLWSYPSNWFHILWTITL